jgi:hypothetical protein
MSKGVIETRRQIDGSHSIDLDSSTLDQIRQETNAIGFVGMSGCTECTVSGSVPGRSHPCLSNQSSLSTRGDNAALQHLQLICRDNQNSKTDLFVCSVIAVSLSYCQQTVNMSCHLPVWISLLLFGALRLDSPKAPYGVQASASSLPISVRSGNIFPKTGRLFRGTLTVISSKQGVTSCSVGL